MHFKLISIFLPFWHRWMLAILVERTLSLLQVLTTRKYQYILAISSSIKIYRWFRSIVLINSAFCEDYVAANTVIKKINCDILNQYLASIRSSLPVLRENNSNPYWTCWWNHNRSLYTTRFLLNGYMVGLQALGGSCSR